jgi:hypothetical protein
MTGGQSSILNHIFAEAYRKVTLRDKAPEIHASFYPFAGLNHTIRLRDSRLYVRVSDILENAPVNIHQALAHILVAKLFKKRSTPENERLYQQYSYQPQVQRATDLARQQRGHKMLTDAVGRVYNLDAIFARLNRRYFNGALAKPTLSWSQRKTKRILGHHDATHETIVISRSLDCQTVPLCVIEFVLYHEMLHIKHKPRVINGRRVYHTATFRADEKRFIQFDEANDWIDQMANAK